jgi:hypothetical protein
MLMIYEHTDSEMKVKEKMNLLNFFIGACLRKMSGCLHNHLLRGYNYWEESTGLGPVSV